FYKSDKENRMCPPKIVFTHTSRLDQDGYPESCPFNTRRAGAVFERIKGMGILTGPGVDVCRPDPLTRRELEWFHDPVYLDALQSLSQGSDATSQAVSMGLGTPDCPIFPGMFEFSCLAGGGSLTAARMLLDGSAFRAFNPSGGFHHAGRSTAAGFCYINDVVLALIALSQNNGRTAFLDVDAHHCNGVQEAFYHRDDVLTISLHESGRYLFPGTGFESETGQGPGRGFTVNVPLPVGTCDDVYTEALEEIVWPALTAYKPDIIVVEMGMDALAGDPLADLRLTNNVHADLLKRVVDMGKPVLMVGGGGYNFEQTVRGWALCWSVLAEKDFYESGMGMGGVMLENTEWVGGLRDRRVVPDVSRRKEIRSEVLRVISNLKKAIFPVLGLR
ncbi:MAG: acetoin utilization protein AcuC, partial [Desulfonatronovibrio sp.]